MSRSAYLVCEAAKEFIALGKIIEPESGVVYFNRGSRLPHSENPLMMKAIMRFLAKHLGRELRVMPSELFYELVQDDFVELSEDGDAAIPFAEYIRDFKG